MQDNHGAGVLRFVCNAFRRHGTGELNGVKKRYKRFVTKPQSCSEVCVSVVGLTRPKIPALRFSLSL